MDPFIPNLLPLKEINWQVLVPQVGSANRALAYFNGILRTIPNENVLLSPLTTKEAVLSSRIEGTQPLLERFSISRQEKSRNRSSVGKTYSKS
jgi:Fic family protein